MRRGFVKDVTSFFTLLCIVFIPFPFYFIRFQQKVTDTLFGKLIGNVSGNVFGIRIKDTRVYSDSTSMYILVLLLFLLAVLVSLSLQQIKGWSTRRDGFRRIWYGVVCCYLALILMKYGADKIFKNQFYLPEPNTLFTPLGRLSRGFLYWSSMGTSRFYNIFLGSLEALAALLILMKRTRLAGLLLSFGILINVTAVNFGFDISVKLFSLFLLLITMILLSPYWNAMTRFFFLQKTSTGEVAIENPKFLKQTFLFTFLWWFALAFVCTEAFYPFVKTMKFNDDRSSRPYLHGAYEVRQVLEGRDTMPIRDSPVKRFFIHRQGYLIFQDQDDEMKDYQLSYDKDSSMLIATDYQLHKMMIPYIYDPSGKVLTIQYEKSGKTYTLEGKAIEWENLPALKKGFHWRSDAGD